jgi:hypothetical protein
MARNTKEMLNNTIVLVPCAHDDHDGMGSYPSGSCQLTAEGEVAHKSKRCQYPPAAAASKGILAMQIMVHDGLATARLSNQSINQSRMCVCVCTCLCLCVCVCVSTSTAIPMS